MRQADLLIHPARQEPLGRVLLEALASGLPAVTTTAGGTAEIIPTEFHDLMVAPDDVAAMTAAAERVLSDGLWRQKIETEFPRHAQRRFSIQQSAAGLDQHYRQAMKCRN